MPRKKKNENNDGQLSLFDPEMLEGQKVLQEISKAVVLNCQEHKDEPCIVGIDKNLMSLHFFGLSTKRTGLSRENKLVVREKTVILRDQGQQKRITVRMAGDPVYGLPTVKDLDYTLAFFEMLEEKREKGEEISSIGFTEAELRKVAGKVKSARANREIKEWLSRMTHVRFSITEEGVYDSGGKQWKSGSWGFFTKYVKEGEKIPGTGQKTERTYVWLEPLWLGNFLHSYFRYIRHDIYRKLRVPLAKLLLPMFEVTFYASKGKPIARKYEEFCREYDLQIYEQVSLTQRTLDPAFNDLKAQGVLDRWEYRCFPETRKVDCIAFWPGPLYTQKGKIGPKNSGVIDVTPRSARVAVSISSVRQKKSQCAQSIAKDSEGIERKQSFILFLQEEGVSRAKELVKHSPHSIDLLEVIKEDYLRLKRKAKEGKFHFERGERSWLAWAVGSKDYKRPKGMITPAEKKEQQEQQKEREARVLALAQKIKSKEFTHFFSQGTWYPIDGLSIDFPDFHSWHISYGPQKRNKFVTFLHEISEAHLRGGGEVEKGSS